MATLPEPVRHGRREFGYPLLRYIGVGVAAVLGFGIVLAQTLTGQLEDAVTTANIETLVTNEPDKPAPEDSDAGESLNILLMGSDVRTGENGAIGGRVTDGMRNDTTILMHVAADRSRVDFVSIPRDAQVEISDCTLFDGTEVPGSTGDFNIAFSNGGQHGNAAEAAACVINTVHDLTDVYIDHWAVVDFTGFIRMVDALGGVPMCIPTRIESEKARLTLDAGPQVLNGEQALGYARLRTAEVGGVSGSDLQRITRQQQLLSQTAKTALSKNLLTDAGELVQFMRAGAESLTTDEQFGDSTYLLGVAYSLRHVRGDDLTFVTVPWEYTEDRNNVLITAEAEQLWDDIRHDRPISVEVEGDASSTWNDGLKESKPTASTTPKSTSEAEPDSSTQPSNDTAATTESLLAQCSV